ncbi:MAG: fibronectin type III domain-containing protein [Syntrophobacteraceae bacterium]
MTGKAIIIAVFAVLLMASTSWAFGGGGGGGVGVGSPVDLLLPDPPRNVTATPGKGMATVSFEPPKSDGGSPITHYTVTSVPRGIQIKGTKSPMTVQGLSDQKCYSFVVTASNSVGTGLASSPSKCVTPGE